jgi:hypothetical protein
MSDKRRQLLTWAVFCVAIGVIAGASELWKYLAQRRFAESVSCIEAKGGKLHRQWPENVDIVEAVFIGPQFTDADVKLLRYFPELRVVAFLVTSVTDAAARAFRKDRQGVQVVVDATPRR